MQGHATRRQVLAGVLAPRGVRAGTDAGRTWAAEGRGRRLIFCETRNRTAPNRTDPISGFAKNGDAPERSVASCVRAPTADRPCPGSPSPVRRGWGESPNRTDNCLRPRIGYRARSDARVGVRERRRRGYDRHVVKALHQLLDRRVESGADVLPDRLGHRFPEGVVVHLRTAEPEYRKVVRQQTLRCTDGVGPGPICVGSDRLRRRR